MSHEFFDHVENLDDLKCQYRTLCRQYHPDLGGDTEKMKLINDEYDRILRSGFFNAEMNEKNTSVIEGDLKKVVEKAACLRNVTTEVCGRWVWLSGETWRYKKWLKQEGFRWAAKKRRWFWRHQDDACQSSRGRKTPEQIRKKYGSMVFKTKERSQLAA